jgi:predicted ribosome quality control (RQC) complex YloA/Tae2 family protein
MYFDALTLAAITDELNDTIVGGRIQRVRLPSQHSVALEVYAQGRRYQLLLSAHQQWTRVHLTTSKLSRGVERDTPLLLLLRKYVVGGRITAIEQPSTERVLILSIAKGAIPRNTTHDADQQDSEQWQDELEAESDDELSDDQILRCELIIEAIERRANILLVGDNNIILECVRHITPQMSKRALQPREPYELPPTQDKLSPYTISTNGVRSMLETHTDQPIWKAIIAHYRGVSPLLAREVVYRAVGDAEALLTAETDAESIAKHMRSLWEADPNPSIVFEDENPKLFAPYLLTHRAPYQTSASVSNVVEQYYNAREHLSGHEQRRTQLLAQILDTRERFDRQRRLLSEEIERAQNLEQLRWEGEMIYGFMYSLQRGQTSFEVDGVTIKLDPSRTPHENAQARFHAYDKAKGALAGVPERLEATENLLAGIDETLALLAAAQGFEAIESIGNEALELGYIKPQNEKQKRVKGRRMPPLRLESSDGFIIYVGRSAGQNEQVTFKIAAPNDLWLHARNIPGAHVLIKNAGRDVPERTLQEAASLAAYYSAGRENAAVEVEITRRALVRRVPSGPKGLATYRAEQTIRAVPQATIGKDTKK